MATRNIGWSVDCKNGDRIFRPIYPTKQDQLQDIVYKYRIGVRVGVVELVQLRNDIDRDGEIEPNDKLHGVVKKSSSKKYRAIFIPDDWADGYEYSSYYVSDKGRLIPKD